MHFKNGPFLAHPVVIGPTLEPQATYTTVYGLHFNRGISILYS